MKNLKNILLIVFAITISNSIFAYKWIGPVPSSNDDAPQSRATGNCEAPRSKTDLNVNMVRARINTGGDMWWDLQSKPLYEVPVGSGCHALFAGSIWVGGKDSNNQLKFAGQRFRASGTDFWAGPLIKTGAEKGNVSMEVCREYDKHFAINKNMVANFREWYLCSHDPECEPDPNYTIPDTIINWPGNGPAGGYDNVLAPYYDYNGDGRYNAEDGDFPYYEFPLDSISDDMECRRPRRRASKLYGDYTLWWVYNDRGNIHTETKGAAIGMEFRSQAFAFATNDELNTMTFYNYNITNRSTYTLFQTYFGVWTDADLGNPNDDYIGCDINRGLGYLYNATNNDESTGGHIGYGVLPPAIGIDFFEGPYQDKSGMDKPSAWDTVNGSKKLNCSKLPMDTTDLGLFNGCINGLNFGDGEVDNERWGMRRFIYFNNSTGNAATWDPSTAAEYYRYLTGRWLDDSRVLFGGTGHSSSASATNVESDFVFPGDSDPCAWGTKGQQLGKWDEVTENNPSGDRRFVQSAGPFILEPGAVNDITIGAVWARANSGNNLSSVEAVKKADDKAQILFETCFRPLNGPDAPDLSIIELDQKLIFQISNKPSSNNYLDSYFEKDNSIIKETYGENSDQVDEFYRFQGYQVYQLVDKSASISDRNDKGKARIAYQCDLRDDITNIINYTWNDELSSNIPNIEVEASNNGITHTFVLDKDLFNDGNKLINNREYYYTVIAYSYNDSPLYNQTDPKAINFQKSPYLAGRQNIKNYEAIPHKNFSEENVSSVEYGSSVSITMYEGYGNANQVIDLTDASIEKIMKGSPWHLHYGREYKAGYGPIGVNIINPLNITEDTFYVKFISPKVNDYGFLGLPSGTIGRRQYSSKTYEPITYIVYNTKGDTVYNVLKQDVIGITPRELNSQGITYANRSEMMFEKWGFSITVDFDQFSLFGELRDNTAEGNLSNSTNNGLLNSSVVFEDSLKQWLRFVPNFSNFNFVRYGKEYTANGGDEIAIKNNSMTYSIGTSYYLMDPKSSFANLTLLGGNWAPFNLTTAVSNYYQEEILRPSLSQNNQVSYVPYSESPLSSVDIVFTNDTSKWTRAAVVEMCDNDLLSEGGQSKFYLRKKASVDKLGKSLNDGTEALSWFPGYAIDVRTGERLNIIFGENSSYKADNGNDLIWNPSSRLIGNFGKLFMGGQHVIYILSTLYDECDAMYNDLQAANSINKLENAYKNIMWCAIPYLNSTYLATAIKDSADYKNPMKFITSDIKLKLRVATPYQKGIGSKAITDQELLQNDNLPFFSFNMSKIAAKPRSSQNIVDNLPLVNVVPNPYYAYSTFEQDQLDTYIRITNLPYRCDIKIYDSNGSLIRSFSKDNLNSYIEWDLKNSYNVPISSGMYLIHVRAYGQNNSGDKNVVVGEKILKWFGAMRPVDLNNF